MKKIFSYFFLFFCLFFSISHVNAISIIERAEWGADDEYRYRNSTYWQDIIENRLKRNSVVLTEEQKAANKANASKNRKIDSYLINYFYDNFKIVDSIYKEGPNTLAWPIKKTEHVKAIVVHHTHTEYADSDEGIKNIYRFHSLSREWGDIGYNYIIGYDGEIYEGRAGGDYTVAAHAQNNNFSTVGIALMGNYDANEPTNAQLESLNSLVRELTKKYGIDLGEKTFPSHKACTASDNCPEGHVIKTTYEYPIIGHLDVGHTTCPGEHLYEAIEDIRLQNLEYTKGFTPIGYSETQESIEERYGQILEILRGSSHKKRILLLIAINQRLKTETNPTYIWKMKKIRSLIFQVLREK